MTARGVDQIATHYLSTVTAALARAGKTVEVDDDAMRLIVAQGYSPANGARFLKRAVDERIKLPISAHCREALHFRVRMEGGAVVVEPGSERSAGAGQPAA